MAGKVVRSEHALKHKGMKAPRPEKGMGVDSEMVKKGPSAKGAMKHLEPAGPYKEPKAGEQSKSPEHKKKALPSKDAPKGVKGVNEGAKMWDKPKSSGKDRY